MIGIQQSRPPFVEFFIDAVHDPVRSVEMGYRVTKDREMVRIVQPGSKDDLIKPAAEWLKQIKDKSLTGAHDAMKDEWISGFFNKFEMWKKGLDAPLMGTSVKQWPLLSPAQVQNLLACHIQTIEDVAEMTETAMIQYGMGARELKEKAKDWLKGKEIADAAVKENSSLKEEIEILKAQIAELMQDKPKRGRPAKTE